MLHQGPISPFVHGAAEYLAGALFIVAPFLFGFDSDAATALSIVVGVGILVVTSSSQLPTGLAKLLPAVIHAIVDFGAAGLMIASPFLFGFSGEGAPTAFFITLGVVHLLLTIGTRFVPGERRAG
jgi:hypothetical protein